ncbi:hypothetical protein Nepgr_022401 [Nepenthes gracilis]|uniref:Biotin carboxyl carrier protein of acetyl-CoA carboxylase n=1 Tax=Nepenthes gracilis TaxID=150966 RepID=A0AAD3T0Q0_NEPGR|nr:hypothetical protein Nepgr_022401 [Nepenthes gracilis]
MASIPGAPISLQGTTKNNGLKASASSWRTNALRLQPAPLQLRGSCPMQGNRSCMNHTVAVKAQLNKVAMEGHSNDAATPDANNGKLTAEIKNDEPASDSSPADLASKESINEFITQVASLVKLVDSRDIVELQLKQLDCELLIRKKEAIAQPASPTPVVLMQPAPSVASQAAPPAAALSPVPAVSSTPSPVAAAAVAKPAKSLLPPLKCPMAGTFYRSPGPGEPPFVKVGDKVQKGQPLCIIEAMKLMNEIEADQSGTIVDILVEDGKSVSIDTPLFLIQP